MIPENMLYLFDGRHLAHVAVCLRNGSVHTTPLWIDRDGQVPILNTAVGRMLERSLRRDPRVSLSIHDEDNPYVYIQVRGEAWLDIEGANQHIDALSRRYLERDYPYWRPGMQRIKALVSVERVFHRPPGQLRPPGSRLDDGRPGATRRNASCPG